MWSDRDCCRIGSSINFGSKGGARDAAPSIQFSVADPEGFPRRGANSWGVRQPTYYFSTNLPILHEKEFGLRGDPSLSPPMDRPMVFMQFFCGTGGNPGSATDCRLCGIAFENHSWFQWQCNYTILSTITANSTVANTSFASVCGSQVNVTVLSKKNLVTLEYMIEPGINSGFTANYSVGKWVKGLGCHVCLSLRVRLYCNESENFLSYLSLLKLNCIMYEPIRSDTAFALTQI